MLFCVSNNKPDPNNPGSYSEVYPPSCGNQKNSIYYIEVNNNHATGESIFFVELIEKFQTQYRIKPRVIELKFAYKK